MSPKKETKKSNNLWVKCNECDVILTPKELSEHSNNSCPPSLSSWSHSFIRHETLYSKIGEMKYEDRPKNIPTKDEAKLLFMSQSALQLCNIAIGDPVIVTSRGISCIKIAWPTAEKLLSSVLMLREGLEVFHGKIDNLVSVMKLDEIPSPAEEVTLSPLQSEIIPNFTAVVHHHYDGHIISVSNRLSVPHHGRRLFFDVVSIRPVKFANNSLEQLSSNLCNLSVDSNNESDVVIKRDKDDNRLVNKHFYKVLCSTKWTIQNANIEERQMKIDRLTMVGGCDCVIAEIKELLSIVLNTSNWLSGLKKTKGILLYGPSGVGKTFLAEAVAADSGAFVVKINGSELYSRFVGETESRLRELFELALNNAPSVVILDDIEAMCPKKSNSDMEKRVTATLATLLDGLHDEEVMKKAVITLALTRMPDQVSSSLRRPGRLDREVELPVPTPEARAAILNILLKFTPTNILAEDLKTISNASHGFVPADLLALCQKSLLLACNRNGIIQFEDLQSALSLVRPSAMREVLIQVPDVRWSDIGGQHDLKLKLRQAVEWPLKHPKSFKRLGITAPKGVLMFGPPGCSKTMIAKALANESKLNFLSIKGPELFSKWVGESERAVREVFRKARQVAPAIVFFDELDALGGARSDGAGGGSNVQERVLAQLLTELDGVTPLSNVTIVGATNRPDRIDKALLRPGRLDRVVYVPLPDCDTRREIFSLQLGKKTPISDDVDIEELVMLTDGYSGAEILAVCHEAALKALEDDFNAELICRDHLMAGLKLVAPRTPPSLLDLYQSYIPT